tara:strand:- start:9349 stop:9516 length:168 start_codon:yes stop_codon:yes gene_type:complete
MPLFKVVALNKKGRYCRDKVVANSVEEAKMEFMRRNPHYEKQLKAFEQKPLSINK